MEGEEKGRKVGRQGGRLKEMKGKGGKEGRKEGAP